MLIDQRIIINATPQVVWDYFSDPDKLVRWHTGYTSISVLSTQQAGTGTRRRCTPSSGARDVIEEIIAWVDGLGYEYELLDGGPYRIFQGRFRLQAGPDGTHVQWTISYQPKGMFGALKERLNGKHQLETMMKDSLRHLRRTVDGLGLPMDEAYRARVGMQDRLNFNERTQYQRRHLPPTDFDSSPTIQIEPESLPMPEGNLDESTMPEPSEPLFVAPLTGELDEQAISATADTQPKAPPGLREAIAEQHDQRAGAQPLAPVASSLSSIEPPAHITPPRKPANIIPPTSADHLEITHHAEVHSQTPLRDTGEVSIWEVFGVERPSEQDTNALQDLIHTVQRRKISKSGHRGYTANKLAPVRKVHAARGLRQHLFLQSVQVRLRKK